MIWILLLFWFVAMGFSWARWLRVAQREHYLGGSVWQFVVMWWTRSPINRMLLVLAVVALLLSAWVETAALLTIGIVVLCPIGLSPRGRTSRLAWTRRLRLLALASLAVATVVMTLLWFAVGRRVPALLLGGSALLSFSFIELALLVTKPIENRLAHRYVDLARRRLNEINPVVIGITGSYGKTTTKGYVEHFLAGTRRVVASPASYNNRAGLCRAINEHLIPGIEVFVAEMGTYGKGEIAELCKFCPPKIAMLTAIGPVHLERFGTEERTIEAKSEIFEPAEICILNHDDERLRPVATRLEAKGKTVLRVSAFAKDADVYVHDDGDNLHVIVQGSNIGNLEHCDAPPTNVACAIAAAIACGITNEDIARRLHVALPVVEHRQSVSKSSAGVTLIDDTFNANPASVRKGLNLLRELSEATAQPAAQRIVVTPGMVELGNRQDRENEEFGRAIVQYATDLLIVGKTNAKAIAKGATDSRLHVRHMSTLPDAVAWVRANAKEGAVVLYANDLPDHYA